MATHVRASTPALQQKPNRAVKLVLADSHPLTLEGLDRCLRREGFAVVARCADGKSALTAIRVHRPDILLIELRLSDKDGLAVIRELRRENVPTRIIVFAADLDEERLSEALRLGVHGVCPKEMPTTLLFQCIRRVHAGERWIENKTAGRLLEQLLGGDGHRKSAAQLTRRELEIVRLVASGRTNKAIAELLAVKAGTVKIHLHNIYQKLDVHGRVDLALRAQKTGLI